MFDITAPIERQRIGNDKVLKIVHSGLDVTFPIAAWTEFGDVLSFTNGGTFSISERSPHNDLHTLPEPLPLIVSYHNVYASGPWVTTDSLEKAVGYRESRSLATVVTTFDPNVTDLEVNPVTSKTVWRKGESA